MRAACFLPPRCSVSLLRARRCRSAPGARREIVYDPTNYAQNVLQAARALEQINNQITSLQNQAQMLLNQARNLASLPYSSLQQLQQSIQRTQQLLGQAQHIAYDVQQIDQRVPTTYGAASTSAPDHAARRRCTPALAELGRRLSRTRCGCRPASSATSTPTAPRCRRWSTSSQSATGALQAAQAGNQLLALQTQQLADLTAVVAAQGRAQSLDGGRNEQPRRSRGASSSAAS